MPEIKSRKRMSHGWESSVFNNARMKFWVTEFEIPKSIKGLLAKIRSLFFLDFRFVG